MNLAITGASGHIGGMVPRHLSARGLPLILPLRTPAKAPDLPACEARLFAYGDFELARQALSDVDVLFMVSAAESPTREQEHLTLARTHAATEAAIQQTAMRYTFLRDNFYSEMMATIANADGIIACPAGDGRVACVSQQDVAQAAANILAAIASGDDRHHNRSYTLTGSEALTFTDVAVILSDVTGKPHRYHNQTLREAYASGERDYPDTPAWQIEAWVSTYTAIAGGELATVSDDLPQLLGRAPRRFAEVVRDIYAA